MKPTLVIPDIHQNHDFLGRILKAVRLDDYARVVLLGDYFDSRDVDFRGPEHARKTAFMIRRLAEELGSRLVMVWGNHDLAYYAQQSFQSCGIEHTTLARQALRQLCVRPESEETQETVADVWSIEVWRRLQPAVLIGSHLLSHGGLHRQHLRSRGRNIGSDLIALELEWSKAMEDLTKAGQVSKLLQPGEARGGLDGLVGGPAWLDWNREFKDDLAVGQIVGHTATARERQIGRSHCLDYDQSAYGVLSKRLEVFGI